MGFSIRGGFEINHHLIRSGKVRGDFTLLCISDLHESHYGKGNAPVLQAVDRLSPDIIAIAGDMVDAEPVGDCRQVMGLIKSLNEIAPVYYGIGNHERYLLETKRLLKQQRYFFEGLKNSGVELIRNKTFEIKDKNIRITGLDLNRRYYSKLGPCMLNAQRLESLLGKPENSAYNILLAHDPDHFKVYSDWGADLVLSGHVHGGIVGLGRGRGLISPKLKLFPEYVSGSYRYNDSVMMVNKGLGNHTFNFRLNNKPEMVAVELRGQR